MSTSVLPQLLEVDSELSAQASTLEAQLNQLREKRKGIRTVIAMFESGNSPEVAEIAATLTSETTKATAKAAAAPTAASSASKTTKTAAKSKTKAPKAKTTKVKAKRGRPAKAKAVVAATAEAESDAKSTAKQSGRTANWHRYVQETYRKAPLPDVIVGVLQAQPSNVFKIADVMNAVFKEDMPKSHFLKARNRVSNILSAGARSGEWYRGRGGTYSVSEKAVERVG